MGISCQLYHAGLSPKQRKDAHHQFVHDKIQVIMCFLKLIPSLFQNVLYFTVSHSFFYKCLEFSIYYKLVYIQNLHHSHPAGFVNLIFLQVVYTPSSSIFAIDF